ncbi:MAG: helix-turn-helix transcriptional regulator, partial [Massilia sp.]
MIANWVKEARTAAGLSGTALGARLALELGTDRGHTKANISHWENEKHSPNLKQLLAISRVTGCRLPAEILAPLGGGPANNSGALPGLPGLTGLPNALRVVAEGDDDDTGIDEETARATQHNGLFTSEQARVLRAIAANP